MSQVSTQVFEPCTKRAGLAEDFSFTNFFMKIRGEFDSFEKRHPEFTDSGIRSDTSQPTAERICKEEFGEDAVSVFLGEGGQGVVYNCSSEEAGVAFAQKLYKNPFLMDPERAEIVDSG